MTRESKRELHRDVDDLSPSDAPEDGPNEILIRRVVVDEQAEPVEVTKEYRMHYEAGEWHTEESGTSQETGGS